MIKNPTTNLDFPSVLLNQGLEANNNNFPFFHKGEGKKRKKEKKREEKRQLLRERSTGDAARQHIPPQNNGENAHYTTRETTRV